MCSVSITKQLCQLLTKFGFPKLISYSLKRLRLL